MNNILNSSEVSFYLTVEINTLIGFILYSYLWSVIGRNCSKVDQIWSITPLVYSWLLLGLRYYYDSHRSIHYRLLLVCVLITLWGVRLTYNFWRKGGYGNLITHEEDYRWPILREKINNPILFQIFNLTFIAAYQNILLLLITAPALEVVMGQSEIALPDIIVAVVFLSLLLIESVADEQHWQFQTYKHSLTLEQRKHDTSHDVNRGFFTKGLFKYCRHPNYFAEQAMWLCIYSFSATPPDAQPFNWSIIGAVLLILLFQGSMAFGESITKTKYPSYELYQKNVPQCVPSLSIILRDIYGSFTQTIKKDE